MPFQGYLSLEELDSVAAAIYQTLQYSPQIRNILLLGLPWELRGILPNGNAPELVGLKLDLGFLNGIERLRDGSIPLKTMLHNAVNIGGAVETLTVVRQLLADLEARTTGAPRVDVKDLPETKEKIIGGHNDMVSFAYMQSGLTAASSVVKLEILRFDNGRPHITGGAQTRYLGTGWVIAPGLLITNHHVVNARNENEPTAAEDDLKLQASGATARFDYDFGEVDGVTTPVGELLAWSVDLDYAMARIDDHGRRPLDLAEKPLTAISSDSHIAVNIIQHPNGQPKKFGIRNNLVTGVTERDIRYFTDTEAGSSGSPVFDDNWRVVALHRGSGFAKNIQYQGRSEANVNIGTSIHAIMTHVKKNFPGIILN